MENENIDNSNFLQKTSNFFKNYKKYIIIFTIIIFFIIFLLVFFDHYKNKKNNKISEDYIQAGVIFTSGDKIRSKQLYKDVVNSGNKFYSILALNSIIENNLEEDEEEILKLFNKIEKLKIEKEQKNLVKFKKALFLIEISREKEGKELLNEIVASNSIWKGAALKILE